jgi:hypothetical protein
VARKLERALELIVAESSYGRIVITIEQGKTVRIEYSVSELAEKPEKVEK